MLDHTAKELIKPPVDRNENVDNVVECIEDLAELEWKFPIGTIMDSAQHLSQDVQDGLEKLNAAVCVMCNEGPDILWAFVRAMGIADQVGPRLEEMLYATTYPDSAYGPLVSDLVWQWKQDGK